MEQDKWPESLDNVNNNPMRVRITACCFAILPLACTISFAAVYGTMFSTMIDYDDKMVDLDSEQTYDMCGMPPAVPSAASLIS